MGNLVWTPDGRHLLYTNVQNNLEVLYRISRDGGSPEEVWRSARPRPSGLSGLSFHPDGKQAALSTYVQETEIMVMQNVYRK
jgi:Tol biopolymer transport system component